MNGAIKELGQGGWIALLAWLPILNLVLNFMKIETVEENKLVQLALEASAGNDKKIMNSEFVKEVESIGSK